MLKIKNRTITVERQYTELKVWTGCFLLAFLLNIFSIILYNTEFKEIYTQLFWVLALSVAFYGIAVFFRILFALGRKSFVKGEQKKSL